MSTKVVCCPSCGNEMQDKDLMYEWKTNEWICASCYKKEVFSQYSATEISEFLGDSRKEVWVLEEDINKEMMRRNGIIDGFI